jgi:predicted helicase
LKSLDRFYLAIEQAAATIESFTEKQHFLNTVYERFFQGYSVKVADTHGIVYTPQEIVDFMCASVEELLASEFGKTLGDKGVHILDPCTGTGNFVVNLLRRIPKRDLARIYRHQLFANEVMLLPYYIAALNIEHAYYELTGEYEAFPGLCFVDTLELAKGKQATFGFMTEENVERVARQTEAPITVVIGNPPYNAWQLNENDNNKNRKYELIDRRVSETYAKDSTATNKNALADMYIKFFRWAVDRLNGRDGIVTFVSNNGFLQGLSADGFRKHLVQDFQRVYHFDFKGNARTSGERRRREGGNIFSDQIRVGVGITVLVRCRKRRGRQVRHHAVGDYWPADRKKTYLASMRTLSCVPWTSLRPSETGDWFAPETASEFSAFPALATKDAKAGRDQRAIFCQFSGGVKTNRDVVVYDFDPGELKTRVEAFLEDYNAEVDRYRRVGGRARMDEFVHYEKVKWSESLKANVRRGIYGTFDASSIRHCLYRPFAVRALYFDELLNERRYQLPQVFPTRDAERENTMIALTTLASEKPFMVLVAKILADIHLVGAGSATQCFPFYIYDQDGTNRRENITDWALAHFRNHYGNKRLTKWDIFHYVYAVLHHPGYRQRYAENLKRELPRIPLAADFRAFASAGEKLARLHLDYEKLDPWPLDWLETPGVPLSYRVEKMRLAKDKRSLVVNASLTLGSIPPEVFEYRLGNRSALEWLIDQYQVSEDQRSGVRSDPNRADDPQYIVRLVGQVVRASVETVAIVETFERSNVFGAGKSTRQG